MNYFRTTIPEEEQQDAFLDTIYHDSRGGNGIRVTIAEKENRFTGEVKKVVSTYASRDVRRLYWAGTKENAYVALSTHTGKRRTQDELYNRSVFYIDLDNHCTDEAECLASKERTKRRLNKLYNEETLPVPTMITDTGRGYGLFYVLDKSIAYTANTERLMRLFDRIYEGLILSYQELLHQDELTVDTVVMDSSRIARLPGTINQNVNRKCQLIGYNGHYFALEELKSFASKTKKPQKHTATTNNSSFVWEMALVPEAVLLRQRMEKFETLQQKLHGNMEGIREYCCFQMYNAAAQLFDEEEAYTKLEEYNNNYVHPLKSNELRQIVCSVERQKEETGAGYKFTDYKIMETLSMVSKALLQQCGFGRSYKRVEERRELTALHKEQKRTLWEERKDFVLSHPELTYEELGDYFSCNAEYLQRRMREFGIYRNNVTKKVRQVKVTAPTPEEAGFVSFSDAPMEEINPFTVEDFLKTRKPTFYDRVFFNVPIDEIPLSRATGSRTPLLLQKETYRDFIAILLMADDNARTSLMDLFYKINKYRLDLKAEFTEELASIVTEDPSSVEEMNTVCTRLAKLNDKVGSHRVPTPKQSQFRKETLPEKIKRLTKEKYEVYNKRFDEVYENLMLGYGHDYFKTFVMVREYFFTILRDSAKKSGYQTIYGYLPADSYRRMLANMSAKELLNTVVYVHAFPNIYHAYSFFLNAFYEMSGYTGDINALPAV